MRLFFALWPPRETAQALAGWAERLEGRAIAAEKVHLTLAFLGGVEVSKAVEAAKRVKGQAFELPIDTAKYWRDRHILWVGPRAMPQGLQALVEALHLALYRAEFLLERRPFAAHVTLLRKAGRPKAMPPLPAISWPVDEFTLVNSDLSRYEVVERFKLEA